MSIESRQSLIRKIEEKENEILGLKADISRLTDRLESFIAAEAGTPEDCKRGQWCRACEFNKALHVPGGSWGSYKTVYFCGKGELCPGFVQKEV